MFLHHSLVLGVAWLVFGLVTFTETACELFNITTRNEYGFKDGFYSYDWFFWQLPFPVFFAAAIITGIGILLHRMWGNVLLKILAPILVVYCLASFLFEEGSWLWKVKILLSIALGFVSILTLFRNKKTSAISQ